MQVAARSGEESQMKSFRFSIKILAFPFSWRMWTGQNPRRGRAWPGVLYEFSEDEEVAAEVEELCDGNQLYPVGFASICCADEFPSPAVASI